MCWSQRSRCNGYDLWLARILLRDRGSTFVRNFSWGRWHIRGRFLGEYELGFERVRIKDAVSEAVICDISGDVNADFHLTPGINTPPTMFGHDVHVMFEYGSGACRLMANHDYVVTAWGNNGWGNVRSSSIRIRL